MDIEVSSAPAEVSRVLGGYGQLSPARWKRSAGLLALFVAVAVLAWRTERGSDTPRYITQTITNGSLTATVTATGNLEPRNQVDIGSELSGTIRAVNVEVNDEIKAGDVLAVLDASRLEAQVLQAKGALASAQARVFQSEAGLQQIRANRKRLLRVRELSAGRLPSQQDMDVAEVALARAEGEAAAARAAVAQARASLDTIQTDLAKAEIRSPIDGVVLVRSIEPGQTVAASLQAPVLFTLAEDLKEMELHVAVDEADIGAVRFGQTAMFTVDAFPDRSFGARITRIHMASKATRATTANVMQASSQSASTSTGVVTYETVLDVENAELLLRPGMTATAEIFTTTLSNVTLVPNAAMRFTPSQAKFPGTSDDSERGRGIMALRPYLADRWKCPREGDQALGCVWVLDSGTPTLAIFKPGATDRSVTQVLMLGQLPNWSSLSHSRKDPILTGAIARQLMPGTQVIVDSAQLPSD